VYLKEISILETQSPASAVVREGEDAIMAVAKLGRGTVFAVGDPWLYNEYVDGRRIPTSFQNFQAGKDLAEWLLKQAKR
jgi:unsaturated rhamnogalacturonyl hydrolase